MADGELEPGVVGTQEKEEEPLIEVLDDLEGAQKAIEAKAPADPNFTLLDDLRQ